MGQFRVELEGVGRTCCDRRAQPGEVLKHRCRRLDCPDCLIVDFIQALRAKGVDVRSALIVHWPGSEGEIVDDLRSNTRQRGSL